MTLQKARQDVDAFSDMHEQSLSFRFEQQKRLQRRGRRLKMQCLDEIAAEMVDVCDGDKSEKRAYLSVHDI